MCPPAPPASLLAPAQRLLLAEKDSARRVMLWRAQGALVAASGSLRLCLLACEHLIDDGDDAPLGESATACFDPCTWPASVSSVLGAAADVRWGDTLADRAVRDAMGAFAALAGSTPCDDADGHAGREQQWWWGSNASTQGWR